MGFGESFVKYILFISNFFFVCAGLFLFVNGVGLHSHATAMANHSDAVILQAISMAAILLGGIVFIISFFGCCGSIKESNCMLVTYAIFMLILMMIKIGLATVIFGSMDEVLKQIPIWLDQIFTKDQNDFHQIEAALKCCGTSGASSYLPNLTAPSTCCSDKICTMLNSYTGCTDVIKELISKYGVLIGSGVIAIASVELVAVVFSLCLANHVKNRSRRANY